MTKKKNPYTKMLKDYPDVLNVYQMCKALGGISTKTGYKLLKEKRIESIYFSFNLRFNRCRSIFLFKSR